MLLNELNKMSQVHVIVDNEKFDVLRQTLEKASFFKGLLEIENDNIKVENISPILFRTLITILEMKDNSARDLAILYEYLGFDEKCELLINHKCVIENCNNMHLLGKYCELHRCHIEECANIKIGNSNYCITHKCSLCESMMIDKGCCDTHKCINEDCSFPRKNIHSNFCNACNCDIELCTEQKLKNSNVCKEHKCMGEGCKFNIVDGFKFCSSCKCSVAHCPNIKYIRGNFYWGFCLEHKCNLCNNKRSGENYCKDHLCEIDFCELAKQANTNCCSRHKCKKCNVKVMNNYDLCEYHKCKIVNCMYERSNYEYCVNHKCTEKHCKGGSNTCTNHK